MICIRVDMNSYIATGHLLRCLSIADAIVKEGGDVTFILADDNVRSMVEEKGYNVIVLDSSWDDLDSELDVLIPLINRMPVDYMLIDSYYVTDKYLRELGRAVKTMYIDDLNLFDYPVDSILCYAAYYKKFKYHERFKDSQLLLGTRFFPLREEFCDFPQKQINDDIKKILILSGGTDNNNSIKQIADSLVEMERFEINAVCGTLNNNYDYLCDRYSNNSNVNILKSVSNIADYMQDADLAISAGGTTLYELCACGTPTITFSMADNQMDNVIVFDELGLMRYAGDVRKDDVGDNVRNMLSGYMDKAFRETVSVDLQKMVDGKGADRIASFLLNDNLDYDHIND